MDFERWTDLMEQNDEPLTPEEILGGWHFCPDFDGLLISPGMTEFDCCGCQLIYLQVTTVDVHNLMLMEESTGNSNEYPF